MKNRLVWGTLLLLVAATPAWAAPDFSGDWSVAGTHSKKGAYTGSVKVKQAADKSVTLTADLKTASGDKIAWSAKGRASDAGISFSFKMSEGLIGALTGSAFARKYTGSYTLAADGTLVGGWKTKGSSNPQLSATEKLTRAAAPSAGKYLSLVRPDGQKAKEEVVAVNLDDDDGDGGAARDGETTVVGDKDDANGVAKENDLLRLELAKDPANADAKFSFTLTDRVALWKTATKEPSSRVTGELPNENATLWVEGLAPSDAGKGEKITVKLVKAGQTVGTDDVTVHVARCAFHLAGHGAGGAFQMEAWLRTAKRDSRTQPTFVEGKDEKAQKKVFWAVWVSQDEKGAKIALGCPDAVISYDGHSNFGMGFAFQTDFKSIKEFLNIADPQVPVNWEYLRDHQEHPNLMIEDSEYADDSSTQAFSDPVGVAKTVTGTSGSWDTRRWPASGGNGPHYPLTRGTKKWLDHHYGEEDNYRIVVKAGSRDMPVKKWSRIYLHSCYSGQYYSDSFGGRGTLFFTHDEAHAWSTALPAFIRSCVEGKSDAEILKAINKEENLNDYVKAN